jgi:hypothetical protein
MLSSVHQQHAASPPLTSWTVMENGAQSPQSDVDKSLHANGAAGLNSNDEGHAIVHFRSLDV